MIGELFLSGGVIDDHCWLENKGSSVSHTEFSYGFILRDIVSKFYPTGTLALDFNST